MESKSFNPANATANGSAKKSVVMANGSPFFGTSKYDPALREHIIKALNAMEKGVSYKEEKSDSGSTFKIQKNAPSEEPLADSHYRAFSLFRAIFKSRQNMAIMNINGFLMITKREDDQLLRESLNILYSENDRQFVNGIGSVQYQPAANGYKVSITDTVGSK